MELNYGLQLYSVNDFTEYDMEYALSRIQEFGYKKLEFAGYFGHTPDQINEMLARYGLSVIGSHIGFDKLKDENIKATLDFEEAIGNKNIIIPAVDMYHTDQIKNTIKEIKRVKPIIESRGMEFHFHIHDLDYRPNKDGDIPFDALENETDVLFELDTFWVFFSGRDPLAEMERLRDRVKLVHIKDGQKNRDPAVLGEGFAPVASIVRKAEELGFYPIVESEGMIPDGLTDVKHCIKFLKKLAAGEIQ